MESYHNENLYATHGGGGDVKMWETLMLIGLMLVVTAITMLVAGFLPMGGKIANFIGILFLGSVWLSLFGINQPQTLITSLPYYKYLITASVAIMIGNFLVSLPVISAFFPLGAVKE